MYGYIIGLIQFMFIFVSRVHQSKTIVIKGNNKFSIKIPCPTNRLYLSVFFFNYIYNWITTNCIITDLNSDK